MNAIAIYVEGGGDGPGSNHNKRELRQGFDILLQAQKQAAQARKLGWQLMACGGRNQTFKAFHGDLQLADAGTLHVLLVDSEDPVAPEANSKDPTKDAEANARARVQHLTKRDSWDLSGVAPKHVHLMVQCMKAWIVADPEALADFYGKNFHHRSLPNRQNLEDESKPDVLDKLKKATCKTQKGEYAKIKHASKLLERIRAAIPLGRWGEASDIAEAVAFLCSQEAAWITGEVLRVSGGLVGVSAAPPRRGG